MLRATGGLIKGYSVIISTWSDDSVATEKQSDEILDIL